MKFPFLFKATDISIDTTTTTTTTTSAAPSWPWPSCVSNPKTLSFRANSTSENIYNTMNSDYLEDKNTTEFADRICSSFEHYHEEIFSCESKISNSEQPNNVESAVTRGLMSERLFFEPGETSSILEEAKNTHDFSYKESVAIMAIDSRAPFLDFRVSMEEMVEAHGLKDWEFLEELLACYLRVNDKSNHGYIVGAFVDLLIDHFALASASASNNDSSSSAIDENCSSSSTTTQYSFTSPLSFFSSSTYSSTSPCLSSLENEDEIIVVEKNGDSSLSSFLCNASSSGV